MKRKDRLARIRYGVIAAVAVLVLVVVGIGLLYDGGDTEPYRTLDKPDGRGAVNVVVYFSYTCPHCRALEELMDDWGEALPQGALVRRVHVGLSASAQNLTKAHAALEQLGAAEVNQKRIFRAIHDRGRQFPSLATIADFVDGHGVDRETFLRTVESPRVARRVAAELDEFVALNLSGVPAVVVDGKYVVNMDLGRQQALRTAHDLAIQQVARRRGESVTG